MPLPHPVSLSVPVRLAPSVWYHNQTPHRHWFTNPFPRPLLLPWIENMKSTGLWRWTGQSSKPYFLPYWRKEKQVTSPRKIVRLSASFHSSTPLGVVSWEHNIPAHSESCLQLYRFFGTWEKLSELYKSNAKCSWEWNLSAKIPGWPHCVDHFERNKCRRQTHSLPAPMQATRDHEP